MLQLIKHGLINNPSVELKCKITHDATSITFDLKMWLPHSLVIQYLNLAAVIPLRLFISSAKNSARHSNRRSILRSSTDARMQHISLLVDCSRMSIFT
mmetsp:Transcript_37690/g.55129  ORF Transcript_37690/g.55129 Transcript_37690/m.55129 type:complete len:98 (-) Transcript_37690:9-302(-)